MKDVIYVALGGAVGSVLRYWVGIITFRLFGPFLPWGTFSVNLIGSFCIGLFAEMIARKFDASADLRVLLITGLLGGFTTFSAFMLDTVSLAERGDLLWPAFYVAASIGFGVGAVFAGLAVGRWLF
ncbi:fluoride efflux transporter CrcB [Agrobacterium vitis]|uniref:Fluoride-specific ion channel FluC n=1 Tax=Agrobacterium vitis TaxID=373 RepID=A0A368NWG6_AGRVI|nr:fluoride efflux transporter CrcB [Agrobacterium vitis]KAA3510341.1 fluoride efflux transporter CrcB [Agrobacterium vitis]KAA3526772.1 fluoride efflux transporter CrcB [Agrobacterium vitis]MCF1467492.1 fluoride efflux transporter CrcB [Agrobacterium vitis]MCF1479428.1 fluoride efflux transporter CrcB [Agrobacterium vitis]MUZ74879.1 fluoride efflux transporter CrcB [Agrobacterium vitis]